MHFKNISVSQINHGTKRQSVHKTKGGAPGSIRHEGLVRSKSISKTHLRNKRSPSIQQRQFKETHTRQIPANRGREFSNPECSFVSTMPLSDVYIERCKAGYGVTFNAEENSNYEDSESDSNEHILQSNFTIGNDDIEVVKISNDVKKKRPRTKIYRGPPRVSYLKPTVSLGSREGARMSQLRRNVAIEQTRVSVEELSLHTSRASLSPESVLSRRDSRQVCPGTMLQEVREKIAKCKAKKNKMSTTNITMVNYSTRKQFESFGFCLPGKTRKRSPTLNKERLSQKMTDGKLVTDASHCSNRHPYRSPNSHFSKGFFRPQRLNCKSFTATADSQTSDATRTMPASRDSRFEKTKRVLEPIKRSKNVSGLSSSKLTKIDDSTSQISSNPTARVHKVPRRKSKSCNRQSVKQRTGGTYQSLGLSPLKRSASSENYFPFMMPFLQRANTITW